MFLFRMFGDRTSGVDASREDGLAPAGPDGSAREIAQSLQLIVATRRGVGHVLPDFGIGDCGQASPAGLLAHYVSQLRENLARYEPRITVVDIDGDVSDDGRPIITLTARLPGASAPVAYRIDPVLSAVSVAQPPRGRAARRR